MTIAIEPNQAPAKQTSELLPKTGLKVAVPKEIYPGECRVAATPETVKTLRKLGFEVLIETGAGEAANFSDRSYQEAGRSDHF